MYVKPIVSVKEIQKTAEDLFRNGFFCSRGRRKCDPFSFRA